MQWMQLFSEVLLNLSVTKSFLAAVLLTFGQHAPVDSLDFARVAQPAHYSAIKVKALYLTGWTVGNMANVRHFIDVAKNTEINSYVIDIKDDDGLVGYESQIPAVREIGGWQKKYNADAVLQAFRENGVHTIGRIVCFKDPVLSAKKPELAIQDTTGGPWKDKKGRTWLDPYNRKSWPYIIEIAREGIKKGFDEIQFDYVRFANDGDRKRMVFSGKGMPRYQAINDFLAFARKELPNVTLSADVFGIICESPEDTENIGQFLEQVGKDVDYISPMAYPSHYALGQVINKKKYVKPDLEPYGVVYNTLAKAKARIAPVKDYRAKVRPYLQDFTASWLGASNYKRYSADEVRQQIKAVYDAGYEEWILWNAGNRYSETALQPKKGGAAKTTVASAPPASAPPAEPVALTPVVAAPAVTPVVAPAKAKAAAASEKMAPVKKKHKRAKKAVQKP